MHPGKVATRKGILLVVSLLTAVAAGRAQSLDASVDSLIAAVSLDSLTRYVSQLSGAIPIHVADSTLLIYLDEAERLDSVRVADTLIALPNRFHEANEAAAGFLESKLRSFGYDSVVARVYPELPFTRNVIAYKPGAGPSTPTWVICAHYDSVVQAPGADDNASGTAVVLEAARIFAGRDLNASIIFGLWDSEEAGLYGSDQFAAMAYDEDLRIDGVLNFDMVGWDGDEDRKLQIHAAGEAVWLAEYIADVARRHNIGIEPDLQIPGTGRSDHVSFRNWGYPAVKIIEEEGEDFNPYYHSKDDVVGQFNLEYFHEVAGLAAATLASLTLSGTAVGTEHGEPIPGEISPFDIFPNPAAGAVRIEYRGLSDPGSRLLISDVLGRTVAVVPLLPGARSIRWKIPPEWPGGMYFVTLDSKGAPIRTRPLTVVH